jgi:hypothetical protein
MRQVKEPGGTRTVLTNTNASNSQFWTLHQVSGREEAPAMRHGEAHDGGGARGSAA